uniref:NADH dehydrogenase [ubiquinone] 1 beta subcomplex subunit 7 n=1 Tax=Hyalomma excavatum TaxID=257692 RepID=A0A131X960_9ACAR
MGQYYGTLSVRNGNPLLHVFELEEKKAQPPKYDPMLGFPNGRKQRQMVATEVEMDSANLPQENRDYCAHKLIELRACMAHKFPFVTACGHEKHEYAGCMYEDYMIRYKEYERERRLKAREERRAKKKTELLLH